MIRPISVGAALLALLHLAEANWQLTNYYQYASPTCWSCEGTTVLVRPTGNETPTVTRTIVQTHSWAHERYKDYTETVLLVPSDAPVTVVNSEFTNGGVYTTFFREMTIPAPNGCPEATPIVSDINLYIPHVVESILTPTRVSTTSVESWLFKGTPYSQFHVAAHLPTGVAPDPQLPSLTCEFFEPYKTREANKRKAIDVVTIVFGVVFVLWVTFLPIFGFLEAWWNFKRMMLGRPHHRGGTPFCWAAIIIIPLFFVILIRGWRRKAARDEAQRERLLEAWKTYTGKQKWNWYWSYAYRKTPPGFLEDVANGMGVEEALAKKKAEKEEALAMAEREKQEAEEQRRQAKKESKNKGDPEKAVADTTDMPRADGPVLPRIDEGNENETLPPTASESNQRQGAEEFDITEISRQQSSPSIHSAETKPSDSRLIPTSNMESSGSVDAAEVAVENSPEKVSSTEKPIDQPPSRSEPAFIMEIVSKEKAAELPPPASDTDKQSKEKGTVR